MFLCKMQIRSISIQEPLTIGESVILENGVTSPVSRQVEFVR